MCSRCAFVRTALVVIAGVVAAVWLGGCAGYFEADEACDDPEWAVGDWEAWEISDCIFRGGIHNLRQCEHRPLSETGITANVTLRSDGTYALNYSHPQEGELTDSGRWKCSQGRYGARSYSLISGGGGRTARLRVQGLELIWRPGEDVGLLWFRRVRRAPSPSADPESHRVECMDAPSAAV